MSEEMARASHYGKLCTLVRLVVIMLLFSTTTCEIHIHLVSVKVEHSLNTSMIDWATENA